MKRLLLLIVLLWACGAWAQGSGGACNVVDGVAHGPTTCYTTDVASTPSPGPIVNVTSTTGIQTAYNAASCGSTLVLSAGVTYTPPSNLGKACDSAHYITIRTSALSSITAEHTRISPCYNGIASLTSRLSYGCPGGGAAKLLPIIQFNPGQPAIQYSGGSYIRWIGVAFAKAPGKMTFAYHQTVGGDHIIFDRCLGYGNAHEESANFIQAYGSQYIALLDSYIYEFHCISVTGSCVEAHGFSAYSARGVFKIVDNFIEASGQSVLFGGSGNAYGTPSDIEVRQNVLFKPMIWNPNDPSYDGGTGGHAYIVKNHFETKNSQRLLFEGNENYNVWGGFSQVGGSFLITPKNQASGATGNICPTCIVTDLIIRYSRIHYAHLLFQIANVPSDNGGLAAGGFNYVIHDIVADGINYSTCYACGSFTTQLYSTPGFLLHDVYISHITVVGKPVGGLFNMSGPIPAASTNMNITNSIFDAGQYGTHGSGGGASNCATSPAPGQAMFTACWSSYSFVGNVIPDGSGFTWPASNHPVANETAVGYTNVSTADYHLLGTSTFKHGATDAAARTAAGLSDDPGADIDAVTLVIGGAPGISPPGSPAPPSPGSSLTVNFNTSTALGRTLVVGISYNVSADAASTVLTDTNSPFLLAARSTCAANCHGATEIWYLPNAPVTHSITLAGGTAPRMWVFELNGLSTLDVVALANNLASTTTPSSATLVSSGTGKEFYFTVGHCDNGFTAVNSPWVSDGIRSGEIAAHFVGLGSQQATFTSVAGGCTLSGAVFK